jgi:hypothetical protein
LPRGAAVRALARDGATPARVDRRGVCSLESQEIRTRVLILPRPPERTRGTP